MRLNNDPSKLKVGDLVTSDFLDVNIRLVRRITWIKKDDSAGSGYRACADGGQPCQCCGHVPGTPILNVDAAWFIPVQENLPRDAKDIPHNPFEFLK